MKNSNCAIPKGNLRPDRYKNRIRTPKNVQTDNPVVPATRRHTEEAEKRVKPCVVPYHSGICRKRPSRIKMHPVSGFCKNSGTILKILEELLVVNFIAPNVFSRFVMKWDFADSNFANLDLILQI